MSGAMGFDKSKSESQAKDKQAQAFKELRRPTSNLLGGLVGQSTGPADPLGGVPQYNGPFAAGLGANEQALLAGLMTEGAGRQGLIGDTISGQYLGSNPHLQSAIESAQRPTLQAYEELLGRVLPGQFTQAGQMTQPGQSSPFTRAAAIQSRGLADSLGDIATKISFGAYESERERQQGAVQLGQQEVQTTLQNLQAQALPRMIEQMGIEGGLKEFQRRNEQLMQILSIIANVSQPALGTQSKSKGIGAQTAGGISLGGSDAE